MVNTPIPANTADLPDWLDAHFPEYSPRTQAEVPMALERGAQRALIELVRAKIEQSYEE